MYVQERVDCVYCTFSSSLWHCNPGTGNSSSSSSSGIAIIIFIRYFPSTFIKHFVNFCVTLNSDSIHVALGEKLNFFKQRAQVLTSIAS